MKRPIIILAVLVTVVLIIPSLIVFPFEHHADSADPKKKTHKPGGIDMSYKTAPTSPKMKEDPAVTVSVYRSSENKVESLPLHDYLVGVVSSEMPADFDIEALKAQALTARTYIVGHLLAKDSIHLPKGAEVTDTTMDQAFEDRSDLKRLWGPDYDRKIKKIDKAVSDTAGQILTYDGKPITASFFSTSNGYTENAEDYWNRPYPYLKSVPSPWDKNSPKYKTKTTITVGALESELNVAIPNQNGKVGQVLQITPGHRVGKIKIGNKIFTGRQVREKLKLNSSDFTMVRDGDSINVETKGYGHGVGMSQYGANGMAKEGKSYKDIVAYYYRGVKISSMEPFMKEITSR
ncbi:stage II sporulation protein D [Scopulibacillus daqui]|uniref:Stage II sporulation protein D n=1 Tax=Scopulibacillus daqui TaxID=1469162 RepID=A0ABS2Q063_9BACL|nr:stage II sporulation protein D [Scopulibacillus daqui]MBM7645355.1 stage II sporulation protein D [Scopulibacillus daqui]